MNSVKKKFRSEVLVTSEKVVDRLRDTICSLTINIISSIPVGRERVGAGQRKIPFQGGFFLVKT